MGKSKADQDSIERAVAYKGAVDLTCAVIAAEGGDGAKICASVEAYFNHGLTLLQGKVHPDPVPATVRTVKAFGNDIEITTEAPDPGPTKEELKAGYYAYINGATAIGQSQEEAAQNLKLKKTALGIDSVEAATPEQKRKIIEFFNSI